MESQKEKAFQFWKKFASRLEFRKSSDFVPLSAKPLRTNGTRKARVSFNKKGKVLPPMKDLLIEGTFRAK